MDAVLIPEVFMSLSVEEAQKYLENIVHHIGRIVQERGQIPHGVVVIAEGVGEILASKKVTIKGTLVEKEEFASQFMSLMNDIINDAYGQPVPVFTNQPRHHIRAVPANAHDQIYCERLGALAVDNALAGYTSFMISQWLTEYVLVPTKLVIGGSKGIPIKGIFWKQVVNSTRQPLASSELITPDTE